MAPTLCPGSVGTPGNGLLGDRRARGHFLRTGPRADSWGLCDPGAVLCSAQAQKDALWPPEVRGMARDSQWTGRGQQPRASWGATGDFTTSIASQGHICQICKMPLGGLKDKATQQVQGEGAGVGSCPAPRSPTLQGRSLGDKLGALWAPALVWSVQASASSQGGSQGAGLLSHEDTRN